MVQTNKNLANYSGRSFENSIRDGLYRKNFNEFSFNSLSDEIKNNYLNNNSPIYINDFKRYIITDIPYYSVSGKRGKTEFLLHSEDSYKSDEFGISPSVKTPLEFRIECKWQHVTGSVEEKLSYVKDNVEHTIKDNYILVYGGDGFSNGIIRFMKKEFDRIRNSYNKKVYIMSYYEFIDWANRYL